MTRPFLALALAASLPAFAQEAPIAYTLTPTPNALMVVIRNDPDTMLQRLGHDHAIVASQFTGSVQWPLTAGGRCAIEITLPVADLVVDPPGAREAAKLDDRTIEEADKQKLSKNMWAASQLDAKHYSDITFKADSCPGGSGSMSVAGVLTIRGVSKPVTVQMQVNATASGFHATGSFDTTHSAHGFGPFAGSPFGPKNLDTLHFRIDVSGKPTAQ